MKKLVEIKEAFKSFNLRSGGKKLIALDNVSLSLKKGETLGIVGESGSGKSTLGKALLKLLQIDSGSIFIKGQEVSDLPNIEFRPYREKIQMVFQNPATSFNPMLTVEDVLLDSMQLVIELSKNEKRLRALKLLQDVELGSRFLSLYPHEMSGGQLQRVALARALASNPDIIFLDEPTASLDMSVRGQILTMLNNLQKNRGTTFIIVSHDLRVIRGISDRVVVMYLGQIVEESPVEVLFDRPLHPYTRALISAVDETDSDRLKGEAISAENKPGCKLLGRCQYSKAGCEEEQSLSMVTSNHQVRCWRANNIPQFSKEKLP
ncbi:MAG: ABC transporter ATP-binding protein [Paracoccaceae bacterium]|nr:ABC transporter ATP-binding protein [Paracoccaceae bacterium]